MPEAVAGESGLVDLGKEFYFLLVENGIPRQLHYGTMDKSGTCHSFRRIPNHGLRIRRLPLLRLLNNSHQSWATFATSQAKAANLDPVIGPAIWEKANGGMD